MPVAQSKILIGMYMYYHYIKILVVRLCIRPSVCPSVRPSVMEGQWKRFDPEKQEAVSLAIERQKLELGNHCDRQPWH